MDYGVNDQMIRIKNERRANLVSGNPVNSGFYYKLTALSLSLAALTVFGADRAFASDVPLPIKKIALNSENQVVVYFGKREGEFPSPPHLLETPGPNHRITLEFNDATVDKINMPAAADLSTKLHKQLAAIKNIRYGTINTGETPKARVVIEILEQLKVRPRVVKLEEESVTINLGDDIVEQSAALEEQTKGRSQAMEPAASPVLAQARERVAATPAEDMSNQDAPPPAAAASQPNLDAQTVPVAESPTPADASATVASAATTPNAVRVVSAPVATAKIAKSTEVTPVLRPEESDPAVAATTKESVAEAKRREAALAEVETEAGVPTAAPSGKDGAASAKAKAKPKPEPLVKRASDSLADAKENMKNAGANLKKFMRWPHKNDADDSDDKSAAKDKVVAQKPTAPKSAAKPAATKPAAPAVAKAPVATPAPSRIVSAPDTDADAVAPVPATTTVASAASAADAVSKGADAAPPEGAEFSAAFNAPAPGSESSKSSTTVATSETPAAAPGSWDWTAAADKGAKAVKVTQSEAVQAAGNSVADAQQISSTATATEAVQAPVSTTAVNSAVTPVAASPVPAEEPIKPAVVAQVETPPVDDKPKISTPIETTETHTFSEPAQMVTSGASTTMTQGAADIIKAKTPEERKPLTVAETDASEFAEALKPARKASKPAPEIAAVPETPLIRDTEMTDSTEKTAPAATESTESAAGETPKAPTPSSSAGSVEENAAPAPVATEGTKSALALYNIAVKAHLAGDLPKAIANYKDALAVNPELAEAHSNLGLIYNQQHQYAPAVSEFRKALAINPKDAITYNGIGAALRAQKDLDGAIKNWQTAVSLNPKLATAHYNLGVAYELQRDYDKALASYDEAVKCDYRLGEAYYRMGLILEKRHRNDEAKTNFKAALKASENSEYSADARQQIALIEGKSGKTVK